MPIFKTTAIDLVYINIKENASKTLNLWWAKVNLQNKAA
jgi:hypothetical protein